MNKHLFSGIDINPENVHVPNGAGDIQVSCDDYNKLLAENPIDIQLLGIVQMDILVLMNQELLLIQ